MKVDRLLETADNINHEHGEDPRFRHPDRGFGERLRTRSSHDQPLQADFIAENAWRMERTFRVDKSAQTRRATERPTLLLRLSTSAKREARSQSSPSALGELDDAALAYQVSKERIQGETGHTAGLEAVSRAQKRIFPQFRGETIEEVSGDCHALNKIAAPDLRASPSACTLTINVLGQTRPTDQPIAIIHPTALSFSLQQN